MSDPPSTPEQPDPGPSSRSRREWLRSSGVIPVVVLSVALLAGVSAAALGARGGECPSPGAAIQVGGKDMSVDELERRLEVLRALYGVQAPKEEKAAAVFRRDAAKAVAMAMVIDQDVAHRKLHSAEKTTRDAMDRFVADRYPQGGRTKFVEQLGQQGLAEKDVLGEFRRLLDTRRLYQNVTVKEKVSEAEVKKAFGERREKLAVPERRKLRHLVVSSEAAAKTALARVKGSESFATVAKAVSLDAATKDSGGVLGLLSASQLEPAFAKAAFSTPKGRTFGPVQTRYGWHVGVVDDVTPGHPVTLAEVHDSLRDQLLNEKRLELWRGYLTGRIGKARICYADRFRPADPSAPPPEAPTVPGQPPG